MINSIAKRMLLTAMGQTMFDTSALSAMVKEASKTLLMSLMTALFTFAFLLTALFGLYQYMIIEGIPTLQAIGVIAGILLLCSLITAVYARKSLNEAKSQKREITPSTPKNLVDDAQDVAEAFLNGFLSKPPSAPTTTETDEQRLQPNEIEIELVKRG